MAYVVYNGDVTKLREDPSYLANLREAARLVAVSWAWDLERAEPIQNPSEGQHWSNKVIRLFKIHRSMTLFKLNPEAESLRIFADHLVQNGHKLIYRSRDLGKEILKKSCLDDFDYPTAVDQLQAVIKDSGLEAPVVLKLFKLFNELTDFEYKKGLAPEETFLGKLSAFANGFTDDCADLTADIHDNLEDR
ncbi:hypothetical protein TI03_05970 [Achromatium sp. WMS1]|nr:hypothetical protein TI03_05970 [Achromatium sp. WMS1]